MGQNDGYKMEQGTSVSKGRHVVKGKGGRNRGKDTWKEIGMQGSEEQKGGKHAERSDREHCMKGQNT